MKADLDCGQIADASKPVRVTGADPYGLDADRDGLGCEISGAGGGARSPWGLIIRMPPRKEARSVRVGDLVTIVGWSPSSARGQDYELCTSAPPLLTCRQTLGGGLTGTVQRFGTWKVGRRQVVQGMLKVTLGTRAVTTGQFAIKAFDTVPVR